MFHNVLKFCTKTNFDIFVLLACTSFPTHLLTAVEPSCPLAGALEQVNAEIETQSPSKIFAVVHISKFNLVQCSLSDK